MQRQWTTVRGCWWYSLPSGGSTESMEALEQRKMKLAFSSAGDEQGMHMIRA